MLLFSKATRSTFALYASVRCGGVAAGFTLLLIISDHFLFGSLACTPFPPSPCPFCIRAFEVACAAFARNPSSPAFAHWPHYNIFLMMFSAAQILYCYQVSPSVEFNRKNELAYTSCSSIHGPSTARTSSSSHAMAVRKYQRRFLLKLMQLFLQVCPLLPPVVLPTSCWPVAFPTCRRYRPGMPRTPRAMPQTPWH